jgi:putative endonuclease
MPSSKDKHVETESRVAKGQRYEKQAAKFFKRDGFTVLDSNWHASHKEIDLVVRKDDLVVFVEVKSSKNEDFGHPAERVDRSKVANLIEAAQRYLIDKGIEGCDFRFDVVTFVNDQMEHFPDAFRTE